MNYCFTLAELRAVLQATSVKEICNSGNQEAALPDEQTLGKVSEPNISGAQILTDSRQVTAGDLFVALRGERFDGHDFVEAVAAQGAIAAVVDQDYEVNSSLQSSAPAQDFNALQEDWSKTCSFIQVRDTLLAYQQLGRSWRERFRLPVVAITGSVGKTTTKELIAAVLATTGGAETVLKTQANYNNEIGVPKTLLQLNEGHRFAVVEMGMRGLGEIELLSQIARPSVAVITNVGTAHIERLGSEAAIAQAKSELLIHLHPEGTAILNHDNPLLLEKAAQVWSGKTLTFGLDGGDICGTLPDAETLEVEGHRFRLPLPGRHNAMNFLAALAVARVLGIDWNRLTALELVMPSGRSQRYDLAGNITLLDETYNAGLESMRAALQLLADTPTGKTDPASGRRIAVLGTMKELGDRSLEFHQLVGQKVAELKIDQLLTLAEPAEAHALVTGASGVSAVQFEDAAALGDYLAANVKSGDRLLFKASRAVALDRVVDRFRTTWIEKHT